MKPIRMLETAVIVFGFVTVFVLLVGGGAALQIKELRVPDAVCNGSETSIVLDCDYSFLETESKNLVIKWYFNEDKHPDPVYQWIPPLKPQDLGILKGRLNLDYLASENKYTKHRALQITNPTQELSGEYKCLVFNLDEEISQSKRLVVYVPENNFEIRQVMSDDSTLNITCEAEGVYPEPSMEIRRHGGERSEMESVTKVHIQKDEDLYNIHASVVLDGELLKMPSTFYCDLFISNTNYSNTVSTLYTPGPRTTTSEESLTSITELVPESSSKAGINGATRTINGWISSVCLFLCLQLTLVIFSLSSS